MNYEFSITLMYDELYKLGGIKMNTYTIIYSMNSGVILEEIVHFGTLEQAFKSVKSNGLHVFTSQDDETIYRINFDYVQFVKVKEYVEPTARSMKKRANNR